MIAFVLSILFGLLGVLLAFNVWGVQSELREMAFAILVQTMPAQDVWEEVLVYLALSPYFFVIGMMMFLVTGRYSFYGVSLPISYAITQSVLLLHPSFQWESTTWAVRITQVFSCMCLPPVFVLGVDFTYWCFSPRPPRPRLRDLFVVTTILALLCYAAVNGPPLLLSAVLLVSFWLTASAAHLGRNAFSNGLR